MAQHASAGLLFEYPVVEQAPEYTFGDFALCRRGALALSELDALIAQRTISHLAVAESANDDASIAARRLLPELYAASRLASPDHRLRLIELQRDIHNSRPPASESLQLAATLLDESAKATLQTLRDAWQREQAALSAARSAAREELSDARRCLAELSRREEVRHALQLSGSRLDADVQRHVRHADPARRPSKRERHAEATLLSYLYRMALKTSPFGAFTELVLHSSQAMPVGQRRSSVRLSRAVVRWAEHELTTASGDLQNALPCWLNNTARVVSGKVEFFVRGADGTQDMFAGESFARLPLTPVVSSLLTWLDSGKRCTAAELIERLVATGSPREAASALLDKLVGFGLIERGLGIPDQETHYASALAEALAALPGERAAACATEFRTMDAVERALPAATADERSALFGTLRASIDRLGDAIGQRVHIEDSRSLVFEDVAGTGPTKGYNAALLEREEPRFALLQRLLPLFDQARVEQIGLYQLFAEHYGAAGSCSDVLDFYRVFAQTPASRLSALMTGAGQPWADELRSLRRTFSAKVTAPLTAHAGLESLALDEAWVADFAARLPKYLRPWGSAAYGLQFFGGRAADAGVVINNITTGYGWPYSRFCDVVPAFGDGPSLSDLVRQRIRNADGERQVDLTCVFGMNTNLHPRLAGMELVFPRSIGTASADEQLSLRDVALVADAESKTLRAVSKSDGTPLRLVAHNFLFPAAGSNLYRFLCALTPFVNVRGGFWATFFSTLDAPLPRALPRLTLGRIVLERRSWSWPIAALPACTAEIDWEDPLNTVRAADRWRRALDLPREGFFRLTAPRPRAGGQVTWAEETRAWAIAARSVRSRKPHYLHFESPLLWGLLAKQLHSGEEGDFSLTECLPSTAEYGAGERAASAEEYYVELDAAVPDSKRRGRGAWEMIGKSK